MHRSLSSISILKIIGLVLFSSFIALWGGSLVAILATEHRLGFDDTRQAYYGALMFQFLGAWAFILLTFPRVLHSKTLDLLALTSGFTYSALRLNCFLNGCCYGKLCSYPWAITFRDERALTPLIGLPLHPTQLYGVLHGIIMGILLLVFFKRREKLSLQGKLCWIYFVLVALGRLFTESFRGDSRATISLGWSFNQWASLGVLLVSSAVLFFLKKTQRISLVSVRKVATLLLIPSSFILFGCGQLPKTPGTDIVRITEPLGPGVWIHHMAKGEKPGWAAARNLLFIAVDDSSEDAQLFYPALAKLYKTDLPERLEEVLWWHFSPRFSQLYGKVVRIRADSLDWENMRKGLHYLEDLKIPYDVVLLVHGIPNYLISSKKHPAIGWEQIGAEAKSHKLEYLNLVFLQACFGDTLSKDFLSLGAKNVISFHEFHNNLFYFDFFLDRYIQERAKAPEAFRKTFKSFRSKITHGIVYKYILEKFFDISPKDYVERVKMPVLDSQKTSR